MGKTMNLSDSKRVIEAGFMWENWNEEQREAFSIALKSISKIQEMQREEKELANIKRILHDIRRTERPGQLYVDGEVYAVRHVTSMEDFR